MSDGGEANDAKGIVMGWKDTLIPWSATSAFFLFNVYENFDKYGFWLLLAIGAFVSVAGLSKCYDLWKTGAFGQDLSRPDGRFNTWSIAVTVAHARRTWPLFLGVTILMAALVALACGWLHVSGGSQAPRRSLGDLTSTVTFKYSRRSSSGLTVRKSIATTRA